MREPTIEPTSDGVSDKDTPKTTVEKVGMKVLCQKSNSRSKLTRFFINYFNSLVNADVMKD